MPDTKNDPSGAKGKGKYALDAGDLLGGILSETQDEAAQEEQRLRAELDARVEAERRAREQEAERKKRKVEAALAEEEKRQEAAAALRNRVQQVVEDLERETLSGALGAVEEAAPVAARKPLDYATNVRAQSYAHPAVAETRRTWLLAAMALTIVLLLGGGATAAVVLLGGPSVDPNSYPKTSVNLEGVTNNGTVTVALNMVPEPEPLPGTPVLDEGTETASNDRGREHHRDRDRDRDDDDDDDDSSSSGPLDISLDGSGIFDRGSE